MSQEKLDYVFENCPCLNLGRALRSSTRYFDELLSPLDLNTSKLILFVCIERSPGNSTTQKQLSKDLSMQQSSLSRSLNQLVEKDWIELRKEKVGTKLLSKVFLTEKGRELLYKAAPLWEKGYRKLALEWSDVNVKKLVEVSSKVNTLIDK